MKENQQMTDNERCDIMKSLDVRLSGPFDFGGKDFKDFPIPKELRDARIKYLHPDIEENSKKILEDLKHEHARKTL